MRLIDADKLKEDIAACVQYGGDKGTDILPSDVVLNAIDEQPTAEVSVNPVNVLESALRSLKAKHMAEDMWEPVSPEERKKYCERYDAILNAVTVLEKMQKESGGKRK